MQSREYLISFSLFAPYCLVAVTFQSTFHLEMYQNI